MGAPISSSSARKTVSGSITRIRHRIDVNTHEKLSAEDLRVNDVAVVNVSLTAPVPFEAYADNHDLGGFIIIDRLTNATVGVGMIDYALRRSTNITWQELDVDKAARARLNGQEPAVVWFTGLSGSGKSTIANLVERKLYALGRHTYVLDGDNIRHGLNRDLGFTEADRVENIRRVSEASALFVDAGMIVLVSFISPYRTERETARERVARGRVHRGVRGHADRGMPPARPEGALQARRCGADPQLHRHRRALRAAARSGDPSAHDGGESRPISPTG